MEVELSRTQSWIESADPILFGRNGEMGLIREHQQDRDERLAIYRFCKVAVGVSAAFGGIPAGLIILQLLHVIPR